MNPPGYCPSCGARDNWRRHRKGPPGWYCNVCGWSTRDDENQAALPLPEPEPRSHARAGDPDTSHAAAQQLSSQKGLMRALLATYLAADRTGEEAGVLVGVEHHRAQKRISDLVRLGYITDTGQRRPGVSGRLQMVCSITEAGRKVLA